MFDGLGYVLAIGAVVLIILLISYFNLISNAFSDEKPENRSAGDTHKKVEETESEPDTFTQDETEFSNKILNFKIEKGWVKNSIIIAFIVIPIINFSYYCYVKIPSSYNWDDVSLLFFLSTFVIFSAPTVFLNLLKLKSPQYLLASLLFSTSIYNGIYYPEKIELDYKNKTHEIINKGDISLLEKELGKNCTLVKNKLDDYIWYASFRSEVPIDSLEFLFGCQFHKDNFDVNKIEEGRHYLRYFFDDKISRNTTINHNLEVLFAEKYFTLLDEESKQKLIWGLVYEIANESKKEYSDIYISRLDKLIELNPTIASYVNLRDSDYHKIIEYREVNAASYFLTRLPPSNDDYKLAMNILTNNLPFVIEKIKSDSNILENTIINDIDSYFYKKKNINLIFYAFYVGNTEMINYLIDNELFKIINYNYEVKTYTQNPETGAVDTHNEGCNNYLVTGIAESWTLNDDEKKALLQKLKSLPNICDRMIEVELNKIDEKLAKYKS
ncbi:hypothetical protein QU516_07510 [Moellerella wisconsensis]|uniref:hypothetical protein n=1 Tax=Moellerella wisconsensis TaxID=158849 RepID=UPI0025AFB9C0|nr:hypothetical protein [Moellerella wisconsensis]WJW83245.1 hypothetical protein QU516_07510 [Moellerella wisconsensis]